MKLILLVASVITVSIADSRDFPDRPDHGLNSDQTLNPDPLNHESTINTEVDKPFVEDREGRKEKNIKGIFKKELKPLMSMMDNSSSSLDSKLESLKVNVNSLSSNVNSKHHSLNTNLNAKLQTLTSNMNTMNLKLESLNKKIVCSSDMFSCGTTCLDRKFRCDGTKHCSGGEDEQGCSCPGGFHRVGGQCFKFVHAGFNPATAQAYCEKNDANLAQPNDLMQLWNFMKTIKEPGGHTGHWWHISSKSYSKSCVVLNWLDANRAIIKPIACSQGGGYCICGKDI